ncbi:hypothetical protein OG871_24530 [Kitasatospora sp. NBC_00374]|uniref:hypothetical protein n=1 Tax=Kitasatospora sp. NBC_00374 TaxID=2975964 RepID=UPI003253256A
MYEYEIIRQRQHQLQQEADRARLVREARTGRSTDEGRTGLRARFARSVRRGGPAAGRTAAARPARLGEC